MYGLAISISLLIYMAWYSEQHHSESFSNIEYDCCIFCGGDRTVIAKKNFKIVFSEFEEQTGSICRTCYHANATKQYIG